MRKYLQINNRFQNSVNFTIDKDNIDLINEYIPTESFLNFLDYYINNITNKNNNTTMLVAPYGKGKSHALLVIMYLLSSTDYSLITSFLTKVKKVDKDFAYKLQSLKDKKYLPVIINSTRDNINQAMLQGLKKAVDNANIDNLKMNTDYQYAIERITTWQNEHDEVYQKYKEQLKKNKLTPQKMIYGLSNFDDNYMNIFASIHKQILAGVPFVVDQSHEVIDYYHNIEEVIVHQYNYDGLFIVFDEFTKFIESRDEKNVTNDMKVIQDIAELSNNSGSKMYFTMIMHKTIREYINIDETVKNAFKGIEGRAITQYYTTTLKDEFDLITSVLCKNDDFYNTYVKAHQDEFKSISRSLMKLPCFNTVYNNQQLDKFTIDCYPLHPASVYLLIKVSEKIAQNERSLFTYLTRKDKFSLLDTYKSDILLPNSIFNYFANLLLHDDTSTRNKQLYYSTVAICKEYNDKSIDIIVKTLALLHIVNNVESIPATITTLTIACNLENALVNKAIDKLLKDNKVYIKKDNTIHLRINTSFDIDTYISNAVKLKTVNKDLITQLKRITNFKVVYPKIYNYTNKITRYFKHYFIEDEDFIKLNDYNVLFNNEYSDGYIILIIKTNEQYDKEVKQKIANNSKSNIIFGQSSKKVNYKETLQRILAFEYLLNDKQTIVDNDIQIEEIESLYYDIKNHFSNYISNVYSPSNANCIYRIMNKYTNCIDALSFNRILGTVFDEYYDQYPIINLELLNKHHVVGAYKKARIDIVSKILDGQIEESYTGNNPQSTIYGCVITKTNLLNENIESTMSNVLVAIENYLMQGKGTFKELVSILISSPFGMRKGVISILVAHVIVKNNIKLEIQINNIEQQFSAALLDQVIETPGEFEFVVDIVSLEQELYLRDVASIFNEQVKEASIKEIYGCLHSWYNQLPKLTKFSIGTSPFENIRFKKLKKLLLDKQPNSRQAVLEKLPTIYKKPVNNISKFLARDVEALERYIHVYINNLLENTKEQFGFDNCDTFTTALYDWVIVNKAVIETVILTESEKELIDIIVANSITNDAMMINTMAKRLVGLFIEDWSVNTHIQFTSAVNQLISTVCDTQDTGDIITLQIQGLDEDLIIKKIQKDTVEDFDLVINQIESIFEDFGEMYSNEQKINLLLTFMKGLM